MKNRGRFITLEGIEGTGKSTCLLFVQEYLSQQYNLSVLVTREPGGTPIAEEIRQVLLNHHAEIMQADTELLLMFASRAQHIANVIRPALQAGQWVLCDRFTDASYAYQGGGREIPLSRIAALEQWVQGEFKPDLILLLDAPVECALQRAKRRNDLDRIEIEQSTFFERVRQTYLERAYTSPERYYIIDASQPLLSVQRQIIEVLSTYL